MAETKQDRILETLKQRITHLEDELRSAKERFHTAERKNEEMHKEMDLLRAEAHEIVGQWEKEASDVRKRLVTSESHVAKLSAALREADQAKEALEKEVTVQQKISAEASSASRLQKDTMEKLEKENTEMRVQLEKLRKEFNEAMQQTKEFDDLSSAMQKELVKAAAAERTHLQDIESLRASLSHRTGEVEALRVQKEEISAQAEKLLTRIAELKVDNERLLEEVETSQGNVQARSAEMAAVEEQLAKMKAKCEELESLSSDATAEKDGLQREIFRLKQAVTEAEALAQQQLEIISGLEKDVQELQDTGIVQGKFLEEYHSQKIHLEEELNSLKDTKCELEAQLTAVKEMYSSTLIESNEYKEEMQKKYSSLKEELEQTRSEMAQTLQFSDHRYETAMETVKQLSTSLQNFQFREVALLEIADRQEIESVSFAAQLAISHVFSCQSISRIGSLEKELMVNTEKIAVASQKYEELHNDRETLKSRALSAEDELTNTRKSLATLQGKAASLSAEGKQLEAKCKTLEDDNAYLTEKVTTMTRELGEMDELLNDNLNRFSEENEKHVEHIASLQASLATLEKELEVKTEQNTQYEQSFAALEQELNAQAKTLNMTDNELRSANEEIDRLQQALQLANNRLGEAEQRVSELSRNNTLLSTQNNTMKEQIRGQEERQNIIVADKRREIESLRVKINQYVERTEELATFAAREKESREEAESALAASKDSVSKLRAAVDELKARCAADTASLKQLISERDDLLRERDVIVERYNRLHDTFRNVKRDANNKIAEELRRVLELGMEQEKELQQLRAENVTLKKSVSMFVTTAQPKAEAIFMERLNLTEGPLRHPKKRSVAKSTEPTS